MEGKIMDCKISEEEKDHWDICIKKYIARSKSLNIIPDNFFNHIRKCIECQHNFINLRQNLGYTKDFNKHYKFATIEAKIVHDEKNNQKYYETEKILWDENYHKITFEDLHLIEQEYLEYETSINQEKEKAKNKFFDNFKLISSEQKEALCISLFNHFSYNKFNITWTVWEITSKLYYEYPKYYQLFMSNLKELLFIEPYLYSIFKFHKINTDFQTEVFTLIKIKSIMRELTTKGHLNYCHRLCHVLLNESHKVKKIIFQNKRII